MIARLIETKGFLQFGSGNFAMLDCVEADVEAALMALFAIDPLAVQVVRFEYIESVKLIKSDGIELNQSQKAQHLNLSLRTYERRLSKGRAYVLRKIGKK